MRPLNPQLYLSARSYRARTQRLPGNTISILEKLNSRSKKHSKVLARLKSPYLQVGVAATVVTRFGQDNSIWFTPTATKKMFVSKPAFARVLVSFQKRRKTWLTSEGFHEHRRGQ